MENIPGRKPRSHQLLPQSWLSHQKGEAKSDFRNSRPLSPLTRVRV